MVYAADAAVFFRKGQALINAKCMFSVGGTQGASASSAELRCKATIGSTNKKRSLTPSYNILRIHPI
jgi:hypothetical protein